MRLFFPIRAKMKRLFLLFIAGSSILCQSVQPENTAGRMEYFRDYDFSGRGRIHEMDGDFLVGEIGLSYHSRPAGVMDGDGGSSLYFKVTDPSVLVPGAHLSINQGPFQLRVTEWASPAYFLVFPRISGSVTIIEYTRFHRLEFEAIIQYGRSDGQLQNLNRRFRFDLGSGWRTPRRAIVWEEMDSSSEVTLQNLNPNSISGKWKAYDIVTDSGGRIQTPIDPSLMPARFLEASDSNIRTDSIISSHPFQMKSNQILISTPVDSSGATMMGYVIYAGRDRLTITWVRSWMYEGNVFHSREQIYYSKEQ